MTAPALLRSIALVLVCGVMLAACAGMRESRVANVLTDAGLPSSDARCLAAEAAPRLSNDQLRDIADVLRPTAAAAQRGDLAGSFAALNRLDPETRAVMTDAMIACARDRLERMLGAR